MSTKKKVPVLATEDPAAEHLDNVEFEPQQLLPPPAAGDFGANTSPPEPEISDPRWTDYVLGCLTDDELVDGNPKVPALRRVAALLLGDIVENVTDVIQPPSAANNFHAVVKCGVTFLWVKQSSHVSDIGRRRFEGVADVYVGNTDGNFARFASAMAETRAEGRALRKALHLERVVAAEEMTKVPLEEAGTNGEITPSQRNCIDVKCQQNDINGQAYLAKLKKQYKTLDEVPYSVAVRIIKNLSELQNDRTRITEDIKGYDAKWLVKKGS